MKKTFQYKEKTYSVLHFSPGTPLVSHKKTSDWTLLQNKAGETIFRCGRFASEDGSIDIEAAGTLPPGLPLEALRLRQGQTLTLNPIRCA